MNKIVGCNVNFIIITFVLFIVILFVICSFIVVKIRKKKQERIFIEEKLYLITILIDTNKLIDAKSVIKEISSLVEIRHCDYKVKLNILKKNIKEKENIQKIERQLQEIKELLREKKYGSVEKLILDIKNVISQNYPQYLENLNQIENEFNLVVKKISENIPNLITRIKNACVYEGKNIPRITEKSEYPIDIKNKIEGELKKLNDEYSTIGLYTIQEQLFTNYELPSLFNKDYYCYYTVPKKNTIVFPYRRQKVEVRGYMEETFEEKLRAFFANTNYMILGDVSIHVSGNHHPYEPDIAIIEKNNKYGIRIDIEIDEPYSGVDKKPIHYIGCGDEFRDMYLANAGWIVIRFSEKQIYTELQKCINYVAYIISLVDTSFQQVSRSFPKQDKRWSEIEAKVWAIESYREKLLNHNFSLREKGNKSVLGQTEQEKKASLCLGKIKLPMRESMNLDNSNMSFVQDDKILFEPKEHIYLYDGKIQLQAVSNVISYFFSAFDAIKWSREIAKREGVSQVKVLEEWDKKAKEAREVGTFMHLQIESFFNRTNVIDKMHFTYSGKYINEDKDISIECELFYFKNFIRKNILNIFRTEWHICDLNLQIAGTIDVVCKNGDKYDIYDWKRSTKASPDEKVFQYGINGLEFVPDISFYRYALQQNFYKYILEKNYGVKIGNMYIVILHHNLENYKMYKIPNMDKAIGIIVEKLISKSINYG